MSHLYDILQNRFVREVFLGDVYPQSKGIVVDVGSLNGEYALYTYSVADRIVCLEPNPVPALSLKEKVKEYGLSKIAVYDCALFWHNDGTYINRTSVEGGNVISDHTNDIPVKSITLQKLMEVEHLDHIDLLKIDIEGYEHHIFNDPDFPWEKIKAICGEHIDIKDVIEHGFDRRGLRADLYTKL